MKNILILGSTGSIGVNTLEVISKFPKEFRVTGMTANGNIELLEKQIRKFNPQKVVVIEKTFAEKLKQNICDTNCKVLSGKEGLIEIAKEGNYDILLSALVGFAGLPPTIEGIKNRKRIALANKETLVAAGQIVMKLAEEYQAEIIPVDSEHSAIFQCLSGENNAEVNKLILTASGGPFFNKPYNYIKNATVKEALQHPNWNMGNKITIDSATMMNKGLEVIEAKWLFNISHKNIDILIHPQSIVHSMVEFKDASIKAQLSTPDMKLPIQYAFSYPKRWESNFVETDFTKILQLTFYQPDREKFRALNLAYKALEQGGLYPCILNAANEVAVEKFLKEEITFMEISQLVEKALNKIENISNPSLEEIYECDKTTRKFIYNL